MEKILITAGVIPAAMLAGYLARRWRVLPESAAKVLMTLVMVGGYPSVSFFSIWRMNLLPADAWLPVLGALEFAIMVFLGLLIGRLLSREPATRGLFAIATGAGNHGVTMGGFVAFLLFGPTGLGLVSVYCLMFFPMIVLLIYPVARHFADPAARTPLWRLVGRSVVDWRSVGLLAAGAGLALNLYGVPRPTQLYDAGLLSVLVYTVTPMAFFAIGLRLHLTELRPAWRLVAALAGTRFVLAVGVGLVLAWLTTLTPFGLMGLQQKVFLMETCVPTAVSSVAVANMFALRPRLASVLFVSNTAMYLAVVLPVVAWVLG